MTYTAKLRFRVKTVMVATVLSLALAACSGNNNIIKDVGILSKSSEGLSPAATRQLDRLKRYAKMRAQGTVGGAVIGGLTCGLLSSGQNRAGKIAACAVAGGAAGYLVGAYYANINNVAEDKRDTLEAKLDASRAAVKETQAVALDTYQANKEARDRIKRVKTQYAAKTITLAQYKEEAKKTQDSVNNSAATLQLASDELTNIEKAIGSAKTAKQDTRELKKQLEAQKRTIKG